MPNPLENDPLEKEVIITSWPPAYEEPELVKVSPRRRGHYSICELAELPDEELDMIFSRLQSTEQEKPKSSINFRGTFRLAITALATNHF